MESVVITVEDAVWVLTRAYRKGKKLGRHPFSPDVAPMDDPGIPKRIWDSWC